MLGEAEGEPDPVPLPPARVPEAVAEGETLRARGGEGEEEVEGETLREREGEEEVEGEGGAVPLPAAEALAVGAWGLSEGLVEEVEEVLTLRLGLRVTLGLRVRLGLGDTVAVREGEGVEEGLVEALLDCTEGVEVGVGRGVTLGEGE